MTRPLRIVHVYNWLDPANGGPPRVIVGLAAGQQALGHDVHLISSDYPDAEPVTAFLDAHLSQRPPRTTVRPKFFYPVLTRRALTRALAGADVAHLHGIWPPVTLLAGQICRRLGIPYVLAPHGSLHGAALAEKRPRKLVGMWLLGYGQLVKNAAALHVLNADEADGADLPAASGVVLPGTIEVIPNGVFPELFEARAPTTPFRRHFPQVGAGPYVLFLSRLHPGKGCALLADAFGRVARERPDVSLVVVGDDHGGRAAFEAGAHRHGYAPRLHLIGPLFDERKHAALRDAAVFCLPSHHEGFSMAITEALAWGRPVVISEACHFPEVTAHECGVETALDADQIAEGLLTVLADVDGAEEMGARGRALVFSQYTWPRIAARTVALYHRLLENSS